MTARDLQIARALLHALHLQDGRQLAEPQLHHLANEQLILAGRVSATLAEFNAVLQLCDTQGWLTGVPARFGGRKWNLNDAGEGARLEMEAV